MRCRLNDEDLLKLVSRQIDNHFGCGIIEMPDINVKYVGKALARLEECFTKVKSPYFLHTSGGGIFRLEHSVQYAIFLYYLSNELYRNKYVEAASWVYYLNKMMNCVEWFYAIELPTHFCAEHPLGCVLGRAQYGDYFFVYQGVTVGGNRKDSELFYPVLGEDVIMYSDSKVIGKAKIGNNVIISANTYIKDEHVPDNSIVFGQSPNLVIKPNKAENSEIWRKQTKER